MILYTTRPNLLSTTLSSTRTSLAFTPSVVSPLADISISPAPAITPGTIAPTPSTPSHDTLLVSSQQRGRTSKHADSKTSPCITAAVSLLRSASVSSVGPNNITMVKRKERRDASCDSNLSAASMPAPIRDVTPALAAPLQIPKQGGHPRRHNSAHPLRRNVSYGGGCRRKIPHVHSPESLSPSMAALLAVTDIPRPRRSQRKARKPDNKPCSDDDIVSSNEKEFSEKEILEKDFSLTLGRGNPMDVLLSPPESFEDDDGFGVPMSRTLSIDSMPSLGDSLATDTMSSVGSPRSQSPTPARRRMISPIRKSLEPVRSPPDSIDRHPLAASIHDADEYDFITMEKPDLEEEEVIPVSSFPFKPLRAAFKSNLTASLRALRSAARSFSTINFPSIPPDDFVTRSLLTADPQVPFTDERRPPVTEEMPSAEVRRYLNPTTRLSLETQPGFLQKPKFSASIQMQTYKIQRSRLASSRGSGPFFSGPKSQSSTTSNQSTEQSSDGTSLPPVPGMRQREVRENPDFIRIAVMEMAMRKRGKLDSSRPGRARWALPPRKTSMKPYEIGADGVPERWIPITC